LSTSQRSACAHLLSLPALFTQEKLLKAEILELRQQRATLEDRQSQLSDDFAVMKAKTDSLHTLCRQVPVPVSSPYHPKQPPVSIT
jgi:hypothetical protein